MKDYKKLINSILNQQYVSEKNLEMIRAKTAQFEMSVAKNRLVRRVLEEEPDNKENQNQSKIGGQKRDEQSGEILPVLVNGSRNEIEESRDRLLSSRFCFCNFDNNNLSI